MLGTIAAVLAPTSTVLLTLVLATLSKGAGPRSARLALAPSFVLFVAACWLLPEVDVAKPVVVKWLMLVMLPAGATWLVFRIANRSREGQD
jgi:hypothetical protein